jgi:hypothetical protein
VEEFMNSLLKKIVIALFTIAFLPHNSSPALISDTLSAIYDTATVDTITGIIQTVNLSGSESWGPSFLMKNEKEAILVRTAPLSFLVKINAEFNSGDTVTVIGSRINFMNREQILAAKIKKGKKEYLFRKPDGTPLWKK